MNAYKKNRFLKQFNIDLESNVIKICPNKKAPFKNKYDEDAFVIKAYFSKYDCDRCNIKNKCIKTEFDEIYYEVSINKKILVKEETNEKKDTYKEKQYRENIEKELRDLKLLREKDGISEEGYIERLYNEGINIANKAREYGSKELFEFAIYINKLIIKSSINKVKGGTYVNIAQNKEAIRLINYSPYLSNNVDVFKDNEIEEYYLKALKIKPTNQVALHGIALYYFDIEEFDKSIEYFKKIINVDSKVDYMEYVVLPLKHYQQMKVKSLIDECKINKLTEFYASLYNSYEKTDNIRITIGWYYAICAKYSGRFLLSYNILKQILENYKDELKEKEKGNIYGSLAELCMFEDYLNKPEDALKYYSELLKYDEERVMEIFGGNIALCYMLLKEYEKAIEMLEERVKIKPDNTDYYNLAKSYFSIEKYEQALENISKARYIFEDETSYLLASKINRKLGNLKEATKLAEKSLFFLENCKTDFSVTRDGITTCSILEGDKSKSFKRIYGELSSCYILTKEYSKAYSINKLALEKYPNEIKFKDNIELIQQFVDIANENSIINSNIKRLKEDKEVCIKQIYSTRKWIIELIQCQNDITIDDLDEEAWLNFEIRVKDILEEMKLEANKSNIKYEDICANLKEKFSYISKEAFSFLSTAEYLFQYNKENFIDFSPIVVEFTKVFEVELNRVLKTKKNKTFGEILSDEFMRKSMLLSSILDDIEEFRKIRNGSAHTGLCTKEKVEILRTKIYKTNILKQIVDAI